MGKVETLKKTSEQPPLIIEERSPQLGRLLWNTSLGELAQIDEIVAGSRTLEDNYLAYESVRKGSRAGFIVGKVYNEGLKLPFTGLEPYTVGSELSPEDIVRFEVQEGMRVAKILKRSDYRYKFFQNLRGERTDPKVIKELSDIYGGVIARFRAVGDSDNSQFRSETYSQVRRVPDISYKINGVDLSQRIVIPRVQVDLFPTTTISMSRQEVEGYLVLAEIGNLGHPLVREAVKRIN